MRRTRRTWTIAFRTGGTANFKWRKTLAYATIEEATAALAELKRMGYKALLFDTAQLEAIGLPETF